MFRNGSVGASLGGLPAPWIQEVEAGDVVEVMVAGHEREVVGQGGAGDQNVEHAVIQREAETAHLATLKRGAQGRPMGEKGMMVTRRSAWRRCRAARFGSRLP